MSILHCNDGPSRQSIVLFEAGAALLKAAADESAPVYNLAGVLYLSQTGWLLLAVPNALVRGVFSAMSEPGIELPPGPEDGPFNAHISVASPDDLNQLGGADKITERGKQFKYTLGRVYSIEPDGWPGVSKAFYIKVHSPELQQLRRSYGLSGLPRGGTSDFHITVGVVKKGVLGRSDTAKGD